MPANRPLRVTFHGSLAELIRRIAREHDTTPHKAARWLCSIGELATRPRARKLHRARMNPRKTNVGFAATTNRKGGAH